MGFPISSELLKFLSKGGTNLKGRVNEELSEMGQTTPGSGNSLS